MTNRERLGDPTQPQTRSDHHGNRFGRHWTAERIIAAAQLWHQEHNEAPRASDWDPHRARFLADRLFEKAREWEQRIAKFNLGDYPSRRTVCEVFGSWNAMIEAAGLTPRAPGQGTPRGVEPSPLLIPLSHAVKRVFEAEDLGDHDGLVSALKEVENVARNLREQVEKT